MSRFWMMRAGEGAFLADEFREKKCVTIGWVDAGDFTDVISLEEMKQRMQASYPNQHPSKLANAAAMCWKFRHQMSPNDFVVTYDSSRRIYLLGRVTGDYRYDPGFLSAHHNHVRSVQWLHEVSRDDLDTNAKNSLGSVLTLFEPGEHALEQLECVAAGGRVAIGEGGGVEEEDIAIIREDIAEKAHEFIKDRILALSYEELEQLVAALLRAMGYKARVTPTGPDRGRDVIASPDGLGLQQPRIIAEVKHRPRDAMGAQQIRSFLAGLRQSDCGLFVSTGGFSRESHYEADRAINPITLVNLDELATLIVEHYETFDAEGRTLLPLVRVYWPT